LKKKGVDNEEMVNTITGILDKLSFNKVVDADFEAFEEINIDELKPKKKVNNYGLVRQNRRSKKGSPRKRRQRNIQRISRLHKTNGAYVKRYGRLAKSRRL
jgi:hypothetical protein